MTINWDSAKEAMDRDKRAERLAKIAMGWDDLSAEEKMDRTKELVARAQQIKETL